MATIADNLSRIQSAKTDIKTAIEAKGVTVPSSATIDTYATYVSQISGGGGTSYETELMGIIDRTISGSLTIPSGVTSIGDYAFNQCRSLTSIDIPSGVTSIGQVAFQYCTSLSSINIPNSVTSIGQYAFQYCSGMTTCTIGSGVTSIGNAAFYHCNSLTSIDIPNSVTSIGQFAFDGCSSLSSATIGSGVTSISSYAFRDCISLTSITINATTPPTLSNVNAFNNTNNCPIYVPSGSVDTYKAANKWSSLASRIQAIQT